MAVRITYFILLVAYHVLVVMYVIFVFVLYLGYEDGYLPLYPREWDVS